LKQAQLGYYKMGDGPFYVFYTPYHLPHLQIASTIGRAALLGDATVAPLDGPRCEVVPSPSAICAPGEVIDGIGGFHTYGLIDNTESARALRALPISLAEGAILTRPVAKDAVVSFDDVTMPPERLSDVLWREQMARWPSAVPVEPAASGLRGVRA
jgi:predicted homoserine dehydrogenase-like protein